jgi:hypothetical protein
MTKRDQMERNPVMRKSKWERRSLSAPGAAAIVCGLALAALAALLPGTALADGMTLELAKEAVQNETTQINYTASTEAPGFITIAVNYADVPCGSIPEADSGTILAKPAYEAERQTGVYSGSAEFTPLEPGPYIICGWATGLGPGEDPIGGPDLAAASLPIEVRPPHISLALSLASPIAADRPFTLNLMATSEVAREFIVVAVPDTPEGCPANSASTTASPLIEAIITGGPQLETASVKGLPAGSRWIFCAWAVVPGTVTPQANTSMVVEVPRSAPAPSKPKHRSKNHGQIGKARGCGTEQLADRYTATIRAGGISCRRAHGVVHAVEHTPWPSDVPVPPYYTYSRPFGESTPAGRFVCRFEPFGLAGTEHNIHCKQGQISVSWSTMQD